MHPRLQGSNVVLERWPHAVHAIIEVVAVVSELIGADSDELTIQIIENDKRLAALREYAQTA